MAEHEENEAQGAAERPPAHAAVRETGKGESVVGAEPVPASSPLRRPRHRRSARLKWIVAGAVALVALTAVATLLWVTGPKEDAASSVTVQGISFVTNVEVEDQNGYVYVYLPVNTDAASVVLEVANESDNQQIREFLGALDTLVPGEYVLSLSEATLHFIVDGMDDSDE